MPVILFILASFGVVGPNVEATCPGENELMVA
jgi:hypothetical protein